MIHKIIITFMLFFLVFGCMSQIVSIEEHTNGMLGHPIHEIQTAMARPSSYASRIDWKETTYPLQNGHWVFVEPEPRCLIHWEVNQEGIIVDFSTKGGSCD